MNTNTHFTVCPHCGFESEDDEMCRACGALFSDETPRNVSVVGALSSCVKEALSHLGPPPEIVEDPICDPSWYLLPGNIYQEDRTDS